MSSWFESLEYDGDEAVGDEFELEASELRSAEYASNDALIFLIDCHLPMITLQSDSASNDLLLQFTLRAVASSYKAKIIESPDDVLGICFFGSSKSQNINGFDGLYVWSDLKEPNPQTIMYIDRIARSQQSCKEFVKDELGGALDPNLGAEAEFSKALWICSAMLGNIHAKNITKRIFCFTYNDSPNGRNAAIQQLAVQKMNDLRDLNVMFDLFPVHTPFHIDRFYNQIVTIEADEFNGINADVVSSAGFEDLTRRVRLKRHKKRALVSCLLRIGKINIGVKVYCLLNRARKGSPSWLDAKTNQLLSIETKWLCEFSGQILELHEMRKYYPYGDSKVYFEQNEIDTIKTIPINDLDSKEEPKSEITLIGFKPRSSLKDWHSIKQSYFIHPDDSSVEGSEQFLRALIEELHQLDQICLAWFATRAKATAPRLAALLPQLEVIDNDGFTMEPGGMHVVFLPFADDIRDVSQEAVGDVDLELLSHAHKIISCATTSTYDVLSNPSLQHHFAVLQALALNLSEADSVKDTLQPDNLFVSKLQDVNHEFALLLYGNSVDLNNPDGIDLKKRKSTDSGSRRGGASKKMKKVEDGEQSANKKAQRRPSPVKKSKKNKNDADDEQNSSPTRSRGSGRGRARGRGKSGRAR